MAKIVDYKVKQEIANSLTHQVVLPANQENDVVIVLAGQRGAVTDAFTIDESFTIHQQDYYTSQGRSIIAYKVAGSGGITTAPTITSTLSEEWSSTVIVVRGADTADIFEATSAASTSAGTYSWTTPTVTPTNNNCLIVYLNLNFDGQRDIVPDPVNATNFHNVVSHQTNNFGQVGISVDWQWKATAGACTAQTFTTMNNYDRVSVTFAINDSGDGYIPGYIDPGTIPSKLMETFRLTYKPINGGVVGDNRVNIASYISSIDGETTHNAAENTAITGFDGYLNGYQGYTAAYWSSANTTGVAPLTFTPDTAADMTWGTGLFMCVVRAMPFHSNAQYISSYSSGGMMLIMYDTTEPEEYYAWRIGANDDTRDLRNWTPILIQTDNAQASAYVTVGTPDMTVIEGIGIGLEDTIATTYWQMNYFQQLNKAVIAGGSSTVPLDFNDTVKVLSHTILPYIEKLGANALLSYIPIVFGGGEALHLGLNGSSIQFPKSFDATTIDLNVHVAENKLGVTFDGNTGDTINMTNCLVSGATKFHFAFASGAAGTYNLSGTTVSNAGTVTLRDISQDLSGLTFSECDKITLNGCDLVSSTITKTTDTHGLEITSATECADLNNLTFIDNTDGHSIKITATGTYTFDNFQFSGGGVDKRSFVTGSGVNGTTDIVTTDAAHGYTSGDAIYYQKHGGSQAIGLTDGTLYYVNAQSSTTLSFHTTQANAIAGTSKVDLTSGGSETHYIYSSYADVYNASGGAVTINVTNGGSTPTVRNSSASSTTVVNSVTVTVTALDEAGDPIENARVLLEKVSDGTDILTGLTNASGVATTSFAYTASTAITGWVRKSSSSPYYKQAPLAGNITATGYDQTVTLVSDE